MEQVKAMIVPKESKVQIVCWNYWREGKNKMKTEFPKRVSQLDLCRDSAFV